MAQNEKKDTEKLVRENNRGSTKNWKSILGTPLSGIIVGLVVALTTIHFQLYFANEREEAKRVKDSLIMLRTLREELEFNKKILEQLIEQDAYLYPDKKETIVSPSIIEHTWQTVATAGLARDIEDHEVIYLLARIYGRLDLLKRDWERTNRLGLNRDWKNFESSAQNLYEDIRRVKKVCDQGIQLLNSTIFWKEGKIGFEKYKESKQNIYNSLKDMVIVPYNH